MQYYTIKDYFGLVIYLNQNTTHILIKKIILKEIGGDEIMSHIHEVLRREAEETIDIREKIDTKAKQSKVNNEILKTLERNVTIKAKEEKKIVAGQLDMYNYKLAEIAHEIDKIDLNQVTPIDALNILIKIKNKMK